MQTCNIKWNYSSNWIGVFLYKSSSRTKHNRYCIISFLFNPALLSVYFILYYDLFFRKDIYFFECLYFSEYYIRMSLYDFWLRKGPLIKNVYNWWGMLGSSKRQAAAYRGRSFFHHFCLIVLCFICRNLTLPYPKKMRSSETVIFLQQGQFLSSWNNLFSLLKINFANQS